MERIYTDADYVAIYKQRRKVLLYFYIITAIYFVFCCSCVIFHCTLPYADPLDAVPRALVYMVSAGYVAFAFPYLTIKYRRVNRYYSLFKHFGEALKMEETYYFYGFLEELSQKNHVDAYSCIFATWNKRTHEWLEREIYTDKEKPLPPFERGDLVHYITQSNFLLEYEILEKQALQLDDLFAHHEEDEETEQAEEPQTSAEIDNGEMQENE